MTSVNEWGACIIVWSFHSVTKLYYFVKVSKVKSEPLSSEKGNPEEYQFSSWWNKYQWSVSLGSCECPSSSPIPTLVPTLTHPWCTHFSLIEGDQSQESVFTSIIKRKNGNFRGHYGVISPLCGLCSFCPHSNMDQLEFGIKLTQRGEFIYSRNFPLYSDYNFHYINMGVKGLSFRRFWITRMESIEKFVENQRLIITLLSKHSALYVYFHIIHHWMLWGDGLRFAFYNWNSESLQGQKMESRLSI